MGLIIRLSLRFQYDSVTAGSKDMGYRVEGGDIGMINFKANQDLTVNILMNVFTSILLCSTNPWHFLLTVL